jgi:hypothetical protein
VCVCCEEREGRGEVVGDDVRGESGEGGLVLSQIDQSILILQKNFFSSLLEKKRNLISYNTKKKHFFSLSSFYSQYNQRRFSHLNETEED